MSYLYFSHFTFPYSSCRTIKTEEVMGQHLVEEFITQDYKTAVQAVLDQALRGEETANFEFPLITKGAFSSLHS